MNNKKPRTGTDMAEDLAAFVYDIDQFPSPGQASEILSEEGIDTTQLKSWALEKLVGVRARQKLVEAKAMRQNLLESLERCRHAVSEKSTAIRESVMRKLQVLATSDPAAAQVYCRKFEKTPDEDLINLEAELLMLDSFTNEHEER